MAALLSFFAGVYLWRLNKQLPDHDHLSDYAPPIMTRVHAADGDLIAEFAQEHRLFVPIGVIPKNLIQALGWAKKVFQDGGFERSEFVH